MKRSALFAALLCSVATAAHAQSPLERRISVHVRDVALRDALDRIALLASIRLSYSGDNLPLDRRVSVSRDSAAVGEVLVEILRTYPVQPIAVGTDHVVLTPRESVATDTLSGAIALLDRVVVTGSVIAASERALPVAIDVIPGRDLERRDEGELSKIFGGSVPGVWLWEQSPTSMLARYGSIRGASSFGLSFPKVYIDGVEVANPLLLTEITPEIVERVEVIRGPQGAALYGSDAISGVVNITSRHEGTRSDGTHSLLRSSAGFTTAYQQGAVGVQEHSLTIRGGSNLRSGGISVGGSTTGDYIPRAYSRDFRTVADGRLIGARSTFSASARFYAKNAGVPPNPLLAGQGAERFGADSSPQKLRMYSLGSTLTLAPTDVLSYAFTAGVDGYTLANVSVDESPIPSVADNALRDAGGSAMRATLRASAVRKVGDPGRVGATFTFAAEQSLLRDRTLGEVAASSGPGPQLPHVVDWSTNTGFSAQTTLAVRDALYVTAGLRHENIGQTRGAAQEATLPMIGAAGVRDFGGASIKLRAAYGKGVRTPRSTIHIATREPKRTLSNPNLGPEEQAGVEAGADIILGGRLGLHLTRFDQVASGLIQTVTITDPSGMGSGSGKYPSWYQLQNVGEITNRGWETQASFGLGAVSIVGAATFVDSRVRKLAKGYTGDLAPGDRMLAVPARTLSGTFGWSRSGLHLFSTLTRASDWINYDRLAIARALLASGGDARNLTGNKLRQYWASYPGNTRLRGTASFDIWRGMTLTLTGENLLNRQRGEPDTITIVPGRTITLGIKARF